MAEGKFATSVSCMDGRIQLPLAKWIKENYSVDFEIVRLNYLRIVNYAAGRSEFHLI